VGIIAVQACDLFLVCRFSSFDKKSRKQPKLETVVVILGVEACLGQYE
jgi:hypothetical protein